MQVRAGEATVAATQQAHLALAEATRRDLQTLTKDREKVEYTDMCKHCVLTQTGGGRLCGS